MDFFFKSNTLWKALWGTEIVAHHSCGVWDGDSMLKILYGCGSSGEEDHLICSKWERRKGYNRSRGWSVWRALWRPVWLDCPLKGRRRHGGRALVCKYGSQTLFWIHWMIKLTWWDLSYKTIFKQIKIASTSAVEHFIGKKKWDQQMQVGAAIAAMKENEFFLRIAMLTPRDPLQTGAS